MQSKQFAQRRDRSILPIVLLLIAVTSVPGGAQGWTGYNSPAHRVMCVSAADTLQTSASLESKARSYHIIVSCGPSAGDLLARLLSTHRDADVWRDDGFEQLVRATENIVDDSLYSTAMGIAGDQTAGEAARIQAIRVISHQIATGRGTRYEDFTTLDISLSSIRFGRRPFLSRPLRTAALRETIELMRRIESDDETPVDLQTAAWILMSTAERRQRRQAQ